MYRAAARPSNERQHAAVEALCTWAQRGRAIVLITSVSLGIVGGLVALDQLSVWRHVFMLTYGSLGLGAGFVLYRALGLPLLVIRLRARAEHIASKVGVDAGEIEGPARAYLV